MRRIKELSVILTLLFLGLNASAIGQTKKGAAPLRARVRATATLHSVQLTWTNTVAGTLIIINRAPCVGTFMPAAGTPNVGTCSQDGTFAPIATTAVNATSYTDTAVTGATAYDYNVTATCTGTGAACPAPYTGAGPGVPSNSVAGLIPATPPPPPVLNLGPVATNSTGSGTVSVSLSWTSPYPSTVYTFFNQNGIMRSLRTQSATRSYSMLWNGTVAAIYKARIVVCDIDTCQSQAIPTA